MAIPRAALVSLVVAAAICAVLAVPSGDAGSRSASRRGSCTPTWRNVPSPRIREGTLESVAALSTTDAWAVGGIVRRGGITGGEIVSGSPLIEHWDGKRWSVSASPRITGVLSDVAATSRRDAWTVGWNPRSAGPLVLHWDGTRWSQVTVPAEVRATRAVAALSPRDVWVVGSSDLYRDVGEISHWDGRRWARVFTKPDASLTDIAAISRRDVWAVGTATVASSDWDEALMVHWDGARWTSFVRRATSGNDYAWLSAVGAASSTDVWAGGGEHMEEMSPPAIGPLMLHWDGKHWTYARLSGSGETEFAGIAPLSSEAVWAVSGNPWSYEDMGTAGFWTWYRNRTRWRATALPTGWELNDIALVPARRAAPPVVWAVGQIGTAPKGYEGTFPAHTVPLVRRLGC